MPERSVVVASAVGLHARPAALFSRAAARTGVPVRVRTPGGRSARADSILEILNLGVGHGDEVVLSADGAGADAALDELAGLLARDLDAE